MIKTQWPETHDVTKCKRVRDDCAVLKSEGVNYIFPQGSTQGEVLQGLLIEKSHLEQQKKADSSEMHFKHKQAANECKRPHVTVDGGKTPAGEEIRFSDM